jgi:hypothetical protein
VLPLSTPVTSGLWADGLAIAVVLAGVCAFAFGLVDLSRRIARSAASDIDAVTLSAYGAIGIVALSMVVMVAGGPGIPVSQVVFLIVSAWGLVLAIARLPGLWHWLTTAPDRDLARRGAFAAAMCWSIGFWMDVFQSHVVLPSANDGITHAAYYLRILESGMPTLGRVPIAFSNVFGVQLFDFYPTGTHALMAIASGFWGQWGLISHAGILKAWFTLTIAAAPWALVWVVRRLMPQMPWWVGLALAFIALPGFRFPVEAAHEGGASRLITHVLLAPIYADALLGRFSTPRSWPVAGLLLGMAFLMHASAFVTLAAVLAYATLFSTADELTWRARLLKVAGLAAVIAGGGLLAAGILKWNAGIAVARDPSLPFSWPAVWARWREGWAALFAQDYGMASFKRWLLGLGLALLIARRKLLGVSWRVALFPWWMAVVAIVVLSAQRVPLPGFRLIGGAFWDEVPRAIEVLYEAIGLALAAAAWSAWQIAGGSSRRRLSSLAAAVIVTGAVGYQFSRSDWVHRHIAYWDRFFQTPRIGRLQALGAWIEQHAEPNAIIFHQPFDSEIWEAWTGRRGSFMYGECHENRERAPCVARKALVGGRLDALAQRLERPSPNGRCLAEIDTFDRPAYFLVPSLVSAAEPFAVCSDATYVTTLDRRAVVQYHAPRAGAAALLIPLGRPGS